MWSLAIFGIGPTPLGAATLISSLYDSTRASRLPTLPHEWSVKVWQGVGKIQVVEKDNHKALRLETEEGCISLYRSLNVNLQANPLVSWEWNMLILPTGVTSQYVRHDDYGAVFYLVFSSREKPDRKTAIGYVWDNTLPVGEILTHSDDSSVHYVVVRSGRDQLNTWLREERNVLSDYVRIYGEEPLILEGMSLVVDSDETKSKATSLFGPISFHPESQVTTGVQTQQVDDSQVSQRNKLLGALLMYLGLKHPGGPH